MGVAKFEITRKCKICGEPFVAKTITSWYCSPRCSKVAFIPSVNVGQRQTRVSKETLMEMYPLRKSLLKKQPKPIPKLYSLEPKDCYTIQQACEKYHMNDSTLYLQIRKFSIPTRQIGNFVYVPKKEIDNLYK